MDDCRCPRCLVIGRPKPLTKEQARKMVERFMERVKIVHSGTPAVPDLNDGEECNQTEEAP